MSPHPACLQLMQKAKSNFTEGEFIVQKHEGGYANAQHGQVFMHSSFWFPLRAEHLCNRSQESAVPFLLWKITTMHGSHLWLKKGLVCYFSPLMKKKSQRKRTVGFVLVNKSIRILVWEFGYHSHVWTLNIKPQLQIKPTKTHLNPQFIPVKITRGSEVTRRQWFGFSGSFLCTGKFMISPV